MSSKSSLSSPSSSTVNATATESIVYWKDNSKQPSSSLSLSSSSSSSDLNVSNVQSLTEVKKEPPEDEIKEYAADAMSELLGWYGYEKVDIRCTRGLNLDHFATSSPKHNRIHHHQQHQQPHHQSHIIGSSFVNNRNSTGVHQQTRASRSPQSRTSHSSSTSSISVVSNKESDVAPVSPPLSLRTAPASPRALEHSDTASDTPDSSTTCSWCGRAGGTWEPGSGSLPCGINNNSGRFCSEACFAAGRRAAFKRARTCDWCRHVRHSVSYVDFQDGESQLQFCSDKCLNQYKMNIFCRETQAHLALHGLASLSSNSTTSGGLITPELWLRDCRSPPPSLPEDDALVVDDEPTIWPTENTGCRNTVEKISGDDDKQSSVENVENNSSALQQTHDFDDTSNDIFNRETAEAIKESLRDEEERRIQKCKAELNSSKLLHSLVETDPSNLSRRSRSLPECLKDSSSDCAKEGKIYLRDVRQLLGNDMGRTYQPTSGNRVRKMSKSPTWQPKHRMNDQTPLMDIGVHPQFLTHPMSMKFASRSGNISGPSMTIGSPPSQSSQQNSSMTSSQASLLPPVTILVPYPIPIPIPLPIPIPIPLFGKFFSSNMYNSCETTPENIPSMNTAAGADVEIPIAPEDLSKRGQTKNIPQPNRMSNTIDNVVTISDSSTSSSPAPPLTTSSTNFSMTKTTDILSVLPIASTNINGRPLRKRRRQSTAADQIDMRLKRRSKFVPV